MGIIRVRQLSKSEWPSQHPIIGCYLSIEVKCNEHHIHTIIAITTIMEEKKKPHVNSRNETFVEMTFRHKQDVDAVNALEHLIAVGAHWERRATCKQQEEEQEEHHAYKQLYENGSIERKKRTHVADERLYTIPSKNKSTATINAAAAESWDLYHGDTIHPIAFADAKLASRKRQRRSSAINDDAMNGKNLSVDTTSCHVDKTDVPRQLVNHCWQRAINAVSNPITIDENMDNDQEEGPRKFPASARSRINDDLRMPEGDYSPERAMAKCEAMDLHLIVLKDSHDGGAIIPNNRMCPSCEVTTFDTNEEVHRHYYGTHKHRGCCWRRIDQRHHDLVARALQGEVKAIIKKVARSILVTRHALDFQNKKANDESNDNPSAAADAHVAAAFDEQTPLNWKDIVMILQEGIRNDTKPRPSFLPNTSTEEDDARLPSTLDDTLLELIQSRLIERYADVPR